MKAVVPHAFGPPETPRDGTVADPQPRSGEARVPANPSRCFTAAAESRIKAPVAHAPPPSQAAEARRLWEADQGMGGIVLDPPLG